MRLILQDIQPVRGTGPNMYYNVEREGLLVADVLIKLCSDGSYGGMEICMVDGDSRDAFDLGQDIIEQFNLKRNGSLL